MATDEQLRIADRMADFCADELDFPPIAGRVLGYLGVCDPAEPSINELADALLASRSAINQAVALLEGSGLARRSRARGDRVDRVSVVLNLDVFERGLDPASYVRQASLLREGAELVRDDGSGRHESLEELAALNDFLAAEFPLIQQRWRVRRDELRARQTS